MFDENDVFQQDDYITKVMFYRDDYGVFAIFPEIPTDFDPRNCLAYQHIGQHHDVSYPWCIAHCEQASKSQYHKLKEELEMQQGYRLEVVSRTAIDLEKARALDRQFRRQRWLSIKEWWGNG